MFSVILKGQWWLISDFSYMMTKIAIGIFLICLVGSCLSMIWNVLRLPLSRFMKVKEAYVQIVYVPKDQFSGWEIGVRFLDPKKVVRKTYIMNPKDISVGEKGILRYQGAYGLEFKADATIVRKDYYQNFSFAKKKKEAAEAEPKQRNHHKRKYW